LRPQFEKFQETWREWLGAWLLRFNIEPEILLLWDELPARIAGIADIARNRRDRKKQNLPLMNADNTDQESDDRIKAPEWSTA